jgi:hypothetical protein
VKRIAASSSGASTRLVNGVTDQNSLIASGRRKMTD